MVFGDEDLAQAFDDLGAMDATATVVLGEATVEALRDESDDVPQVLVDLELPPEAVVLVIRRGSLPDLVEDAACTIDGVAHQVRRVGPATADGAMTRVVVVPA